MMLKLALVLGLLPLAAAAQTCTNTIFNDATYSVCQVDAAQDLRLFLYDAQGAVLGTFGRIDAELAAEGKQLVFAMNAGMYHRDRRPVGLYVENGEQVTPIVTAGSAGNFGMRPNGVFCVGPDGGFSIVESRAHAANPPNCRHATQSGPLLVIDGAYHPRFIADSPSRLIRNGVGVSRDGQRAFFVMSSNRVNFLEFATFFREGLGLRQALYLDGNISRLYAPELGRNDFGFPMGPIVGLAAPRP
jgi:uncharacterized protein YigE (DUF2233 family)